MPKYRLLMGRHQEVKGGELYKRGDVFKSDRDLVALFGKNRFERVGKIVYEDEDDDEPEVESDDTPPEFPADVTSEFAEAKDLGVVVIQQSKAVWNVYESEDEARENALNSKTLKSAKQVTTFLTTME